MKLNSSLFYILFISLLLFGFTKEENPNYYLFPIKPGERNFISGNFGELRGDHLHSGIDIKVGGIPGAPVYAAADGHISRIKVAEKGYGNALYITHPNNTITVYAHLRNFSEEIENQVREKQYRIQSFETELYPDRQKFQVKKGQQIGNAGNSGSSGGAHLHFEIRDAYHRPFDPLQYFNFKELNDNTPPMVRKVALVTLNDQARINGKFGRFEFRIYNNGNNYYINPPVSVHGKIGVEIAAYDKADAVRNLYGVSKIDLSIDQEKKFKLHINKFSFRETSNIKVHTNYEALERENRSYHKLYIDDGNRLGFYETANNRGALNIRDTLKHDLRINLEDAFANKSYLNIPIKGKLKEDEIASSSLELHENGYQQELHKNILKLEVDKPNLDSLEQKKATFYVNRMAQEKYPEYVINNTRAVYLWDMRRGIPDSINLINKFIEPGYQVMVPSGNAFNYYQPAMDLYFTKSDLFDTLYLKTSYRREGDKEYFKIQNELTPLRRNIKINLKPQRSYPHRKKTHVYSLGKNGNYNYVGGEWENRNITFKTRDFKEFVLLPDTMPPSITPIKLNKREVRFIIDDERSGIDTYNAYLDGNWLLMAYDYKRNLIWSEKPDDLNTLEGKLRLEITDKAGNESVYTTNLK